MNPNKFNGGKMLHIFKMDPPDPNSFSRKYNQEFYSEEAEEAFLKGTYYVKIDGSNHCIVKEGDSITLYQRYDSGGKELPDLMTLPESPNPATYNSGPKLHSYYYRLPQTRNPKGKPTKLSKLYDSLQKEAEEILKDSSDGHYTVEIVGKKFNKTPGVEEPAKIAFHQDQILDIDNFNNLEDLTVFFNEYYMEGIVIEHNGKYWKAVTNCTENPRWKKSDELPTIPIIFRT